MHSVGTQAGTAAEAALSAATQTEMESSVAAVTKTDLPLRDDQVKVAIQTEQSRVGTPEIGYESAGSSTRTYKEAASRAAISHEKPDEARNADRR